MRRLLYASMTIGLWTVQPAAVVPQELALPPAADWLQQYPRVEQYLSDDNEPPWLDQPMWTRGASRHKNVELCSWRV
jgi:hypothetical protein